MMRAIWLCRRASATRRCATRRVTSATAPVANDVDDEVTVRPMIAPMATATAKSNAPSWATVRRSPSRRPMTTAAKIRTALTATQPRPLVPPTSSSNRFTLLARYLPGLGLRSDSRHFGGRHPQGSYIGWMRRGKHAACPTASLATSPSPHIVRSGIPSEPATVQHIADRPARHLHFADIYACTETAMLDAQITEVRNGRRCLFSRGPFRLKWPP
jgi:hypothetical protein